MTLAFLDRLKHEERFPSGEISLFDCDIDTTRTLEKRTEQVLKGFPVQCHIYHTDFIEYATFLILKTTDFYTRPIEPAL